MLLFGLCAILISAPSLWASEQGQPEERPVISRFFPNPSPGAVWFVFTGEWRGQVIELYDLTGRRIRRLPPSGFYWDGRDAAGRRVPTGVYLARRGSWIGRILIVR
jgi:hypothetical protein